MIGITAAVAVGFIVIVAGSSNSEMVGPVSVFALCGLLAYAINWLVFLPSNRAKTERYFDLTGSATYVTVVVVALLLSGDLDARALVVAAMVVIWAVRLGTFLYRRIRRTGRDDRFDEIKVDTIRFLLTWTLQGLWVLLTMACALAIITASDRQPLGLIGLAGVVVWAAGFAIEVIADQQKAAFKSDPTNKGRFISNGLWAWSRHPNYFGEIVLWTGIAVVALPVLSGWRWLMVISPVFVFLLLTRISGIPMLEARAEERWGDDKGFRRYKQATPALILRPPRSLSGG